MTTRHVPERGCAGGTRCSRGQSTSRSVGRRYTPLLVPRAPSVKSARAVEDLTEGARGTTFSRDGRRRCSSRNCAGPCVVILAVRRF